jgi:hypothetical protein
MWRSQIACERFIQRGPEDLARTGREGVQIGIEPVRMTAFLD